MADAATEQAPPPPALAFDAVALAKTLLRTVPAGALATIDEQHQPFASLVSVATDVDGSPLLLLSALAAHTRHLAAGGRCSLLLARPGRGDPLAHPRLTLTGRARRLARDSCEGGRAKWRFLNAHPKAELYADFGDFAFWIIDIDGVHLNGGFARAASLPWREIGTEVDGADALLAAEAGALAHMNADHAEAIGLYATALLGAPNGRWRLTGIDPEGCDLACGDDRRRLAFPRPVQTPDALRAVLVELAATARQSIGTQA